MIRNNNMAVSTHMAVRHLKGAKQKSMTMVFAVLLSSFLMFCIFTVGITYFRMLRVQNLRLQGGEYDAVLYGVSKEQMEICKNDPVVEKAGLFCMSGYLEETEYDKTPDVVLAYADEVYWKKIKDSVKTWVRGAYPTKIDEVMVTEQVLNQCGLNGLDVGDCFKAVYASKEQKNEKVFRISGIWEGFGDTGTMFVSEQFYTQSGYTPENVASGRYVIDFKKDIMTKSEQDAFIGQMQLEKNQALVFTGDLGHSVEIFFATIYLVCMICMCAYLLVYNVMYLSVAGNIKYYGMLQTIGMTQRQIRRFVNSQMFVIGSAGIVGGVFSGSIVSFVLVPAAVSSLGIRTEHAGGVMVSFYPEVFLLTVLLTAFTLWAAGRKPAKIAVRCSPLEALGYCPAAMVNKSHKTGKGSLIWRMAKKQLIKDKRRSAVVMLSLSAGMTILLSVSVLVRAQMPENAVYNYRNFDVMLKNDTVNKEQRKDRISIFDQNLLEKIRATKGVAEVEPFVYTEIIIPWEPDFMDKWMKECYEVWTEEPYKEGIQNYKKHPEQFSTSLVGITETDFRELNETLEEQVDEQAFLNGETCFLFRDRLNFENKDAAGKTISCVQYGNKENVRTFEVAAFTDVSEYCAYIGYTPTVIVIDHAVEDFVKEPDIFRINIRYEEQYDTETEQVLFETLGKITYARDYSYSSKIEDTQEVRKAQGKMMQIGMGIVTILAMVGFLNYVNTSVGNMQSRKLEVSVLESIGMTGRQVRKMLAMEGLMYAAGACLITATAGMGLSYCLYRAMSYGGTHFTVPIVPVLAAVAVTAAACMIIPVVVHCQYEKRHTIIEYVKGME